MFFQSIYRLSGDFSPKENYQKAQMLHLYLNLAINLKNYLVPWLPHYLSVANLLCFKYLLNQSSTFHNLLALQLPRTVLKGNCFCQNRRPFPLPQFIVLGIRGHRAEVVSVLTRTQAFRGENTRWVEYSAVFHLLPFYEVLVSWHFSSSQAWC